MSSAHVVQDVKQEFEQVTKKQKTHIKSLNYELDNLLQFIETAKEQVRSEKTAFRDALPKIQKEIKESLKKVQKAHKDFHAQLGKYGKAIDKTFNCEQEKAYQDSWQVQQQTLDLIIAEHLYREGLFSAGEMVESAAGVKVDDAHKQLFAELHHILEQLGRKNVQPALSWCQKKRQVLQERASSLEFQIHKLQYVYLLTATREMQEQGVGGLKQAIQYARTNFSQFSHQNMDEIRFLMGAILYAQKLPQSPYKELLDTRTWERIAEQLNKEYCAIAEKAILSPLYVAVTAGSIALPTLLKMMAIKEQHARVVSSAADQNQPTDQLSVEIKLGPEFQFHSIFACPVSKEQTNAHNPPMLMPCGHVISKEAISKLARNYRHYSMHRQVDNSSERFKCPYCPTEATLSECRQVHF